jgi:formiminotetrahydrofolate cyclodeaminase
MSSSASDVGVGNLMLWAGLQGAYLNVRINAKSVKGNSKGDELLQRAGEIERLGKIEYELIAGMIQV